LASVGRWKQAAPYFEKQFRLGGTDPISLGGIDPNWSFVLSSLPLYFDDPAAYRRYCRQVLDHFGSSQDAFLVANLLQWGPLAGDSGIDPQVLLGMADRCLVGNEKHFAYRWMVTAKGMAEYRAGRMEQAVEWLRKADPLMGEKDHKAAIHFFLAMAHQRLNRGEEAKAAFQQALEFIETEFGSLDEYQPGKGRWYAWPYCQVLRREAKAALAVR
jgi:hypothetical protein